MRLVNMQNNCCSAGHILNDGVLYRKPEHHHYVPFRYCFTILNLKIPARASHVKVRLFKGLLHHFLMLKNIKSYIQQFTYVL
jgi:hypothetical protein